MRSYSISVAILFFALTSSPQTTPAKHPFTAKDWAALHSAGVTAVSPNGDILYQVSHGGEKGPTHQEWWTVAPDGSNPAKLDLPEGFLPMGFTRDGHGLYGSWKVNGKSQLAIFPISDNKAAAVPSTVVLLPRGIDSARPRRRAPSSPSSPTRVRLTRSTMSATFRSPISPASTSSTPTAPTAPGGARPSGTSPAASTRPSVPRLDCRRPIPRRPLQPAPHRPPRCQHRSSMSAPPPVRATSPTLPIPSPAWPGPTTDTTSPSSPQSPPSSPPNTSTPSPLPAEQPRTAPPTSMPPLPPSEAMSAAASWSSLIAAFAPKSTNFDDGSSQPSSSSGPTAWSPACPSARPTQEPANRSPSTSAIRSTPATSPSPTATTSAKSPTKATPSSPRSISAGSRRPLEKQRGNRPRRHRHLPRRLRRRPEVQIPRPAPRRSRSQRRARPRSVLPHHRRPRLRGAAA